MAYVIFFSPGPRRALEAAARADGVPAVSLPLRSGPVARHLGPLMLRIAAERLSATLRRHDGLIKASDVRAVVAEDEEEHARLRELLRGGQLELDRVRPPGALETFRRGDRSVDQLGVSTFLWGHIGEELRERSPGSLMYAAAFGVLAFFFLLVVVVGPVAMLIGGVLHLLLGLPFEYGVGLVANVYVVTYSLSAVAIFCWLYYKSSRV